MRVAFRRSARMHHLVGLDFTRSHQARGSRQSVAGRGVHATRLLFSLQFQISLSGFRVFVRYARTAVIGYRDRGPRYAAHAACCTNVLANARLATLTQRGRRLPRGVHRF